MTHSSYLVLLLALEALITIEVSQGQTVKDVLPSPVYPSIRFGVSHVQHVFVQQDKEETVNSSLKSQSQSFVITASNARLLQPAVNASYGPLSVDAPIPSNLLLSGFKIQPFILTRQVRSSSPLVKILFHMSLQGDVSVAEDIRSDQSGAVDRDKTHCVTAYAFWETREVRGACSVSPGGFCVAQLKPEPLWFSSSSRSGSFSREAGRGPQGTQAEVYFQSRSELTGQCTPQDSLQRLWVGRARALQGSGTPMRRIGSVTLLRTPPGNPTYLRLRLGGAVVIQTSSKPLKTTDVATFYIFLASISTLENFTLRATVKSGLSFSAARLSDSALWDIVVEPGRGATPFTVSVFCQRRVSVTAKRGLLEVLQLDFVPSEVSEQIQSQSISWRLEIPGNVKDVGLMRMFTTQRDFVGLAPLVMNADVLNTAVLTGEKVSVPVKTLVVEADGSVTDVTNSTSCVSTQEEVLKVSPRCDFVFVDGKETVGRSSVMVNFTYGFLSAQLEMRVWMPRLPMSVHIADTELSQIKGWRVPISTGSRRSNWDSEEEEEMRKGRGCMLQYQLSPIRVLAAFTAQSDAETPAVPLTAPLTQEEPLEFFMGADWQVDVTSLVRSYVKVSDPEVAKVSDGVILQGRAVGTTTVMVVSPVTSAVLGERGVRVVDDKVSVTDLGVQLVSGLSLSLQLSPEANRAIVATATIREVIAQLQQEAVVSCWVHFSDGAIVPLDLFDRSVYSLSVTTPDESVATVRRTPQHTFVKAQGEAEGRGAVVRVELRICEDCQKSKRKSKLVASTSLLRMNVQGNSVSAEEDVGGTATDRVGGFPSEVVGEIKTSQTAVTDGDKRLFRSTVTDPSMAAETTTSNSPSTRSVSPHVVWIGNTSRATRATTYAAATTASKTRPTLSTPQSSSKLTTPGLAGKDDGKSFGNMVEKSNKDDPKAELTPKKEAPKTPSFIESDLIRTFRSMSDIEIAMYALVGVSCVAVFAFLVNCASYTLCFRSQKTPIQASAGPPGDSKDHKHDWVWLGSGSNRHRNPPPPGTPAPPGTLKRERPLESRHSVDSMGHHHHNMENSIPTVSTSAFPERTATLGRCRTSSQQQLPCKALDPLMSHRSATLLARPQRSEPLHSPTSKRNQVQFTTFTTLDIKHLAALKKNGVDLNWANRQVQAPVPPVPPVPPEPPAPLPDMPWPVVKAVGEPQ